MLLKQRVAYQFENLGNFLGLLFIIGLLIFAFFIQIDMRELPCPLCLLQRVGFVGIGIGFAFNLHFGYSPKNYAIALLSSIYTAATALRQIALHVLPGTGSYGTVIFDLHLYTWSFIMAVVFMGWIALLLIITQSTPKKPTKKWQTWIQILTLIFALVILANVIAVFLECGIKVCPDNPTNYEIIEKIMN